MALHKYVFVIIIIITIIIAILSPPAQSRRQKN